MVSEIYTDEDFVFEIVPTPRQSDMKMFALGRDAAPHDWTDERVMDNVKAMQREYDETTTYLSPMFQVLRRVLWDEQHGFTEATPTYLSIKRNDREPLCDWRAKQRIKNAVLGDHWEAVELYPQEDRLVDTSNQYHLFAWEAVFPIYLFNTREVWSKKENEDRNQRLGMKTKQR